MRKWLVLFVLTFFTVVNCFGIDEEEVVPPSIPPIMVKYREKAMRQFQRLSCREATGNIHLLEIYYLKLTCGKDNRDTFSVENLFSNLEYIEGRGQYRRFPRIWLYIYDDAMEVLAGNDSWMNVSCSHRTPDYTKRELEVLGGNKFDYVFQIEGIDMSSIFFAYDGDQIYVFDNSIDGEESLMPIDQYMDLFWTEDFHISLSEFL